VDNTNKKIMAKKVRSLAINSNEMERKQFHIDFEKAKT